MLGEAQHPWICDRAVVIYGQIGQQVMVVK